MRTLMHFQSLLNVMQSRIAERKFLVLRSPEHTPHLDPIADKIPELDPTADILLLIGRDALPLHKIRESRNGPRDEPWVSTP